MTTVWNHIATTSRLNMDGPLTIREVVDKFGLTLRTLRFWEGKRLIEPLREGKVRLYPPVEVTRIARIVELRRAGMKVSDIRMVLRMMAQGEMTDAYVATRLAVLRREALARLAAIDCIAQALDGSAP